MKIRILVFCLVIFLIQNQSSAQKKVTNLVSTILFEHLDDSSKVHKNAQGAIAIENPLSDTLLFNMMDVRNNKYNSYDLRTLQRIFISSVTNDPNKSFVDTPEPVYIDYLPYRENGKWGVKKERLADYIDAVYDDIWTCRDAKYWLLKQGQYWGAFDYELNQILEFKYDEIEILFNDYLKITSNGEVGMSQSSDIVLDPKFEKIEKLRGGCCCSDSINRNYWLVSHENNQMIYNIRSEKFEIEGLDSLQDITGSKTYMDYYVFKNNLKGFVRLSCDKVSYLEPNYDDVERLSFNSNLRFRVNKGSKEGIVAIDDILTDNIYFDSVSALSAYSLIGMNNDSSGVFYDFTKSENVEFGFSTYATTEFGYLLQDDKKRNKKVDLLGRIWDCPDGDVKTIGGHAMKNRTPYALLKNKGKMGLIDLLGENHLQTKYDTISNIIYGDYQPRTHPLAVKKDGKYGMFTLYYQNEIEFTYDSMFVDEHRFVTPGTIRAIVIKNGKYGVVDNKNEAIIDPVHDGIRFLNWYNFGVKENKKEYLYSQTGKRLSEVSFDEIGLGSIETEENGVVYYYKTRNDSLYGFITNEGSVVIPPKYKELRSYKNGIAIAGSPGSLTLLDKEGVELTEKRYDELNYMNGSIAVAGMNNKYGYLNIDGTELTPLKYDKCGSFYSNQNAEVEQEGKCGFVNESGIEVIPLIYTSCYENTHAKKITAEINGERRTFNLDGECIENCN